MKSIMQNKQHKTIAMKKIFVGLFLLGTMSMALAQQTPDNQKNMEQRKAEMQKKHQERIDEMKKDLNLSDAQVQKMNVLHQKNQEDRMRRMEQRHQQRIEMKKKHEQMDNEMKQILTPEQYQKWQTKRQERMKDAKGKSRKAHFKKEQPKADMEAKK